MNSDEVFTLKVIRNFGKIGEMSIREGEIERVVIWTTGSVPG